ncbi:MAG TPA: biotin transporter BioY [Planktothrix sp.]
MRLVELGNGKVQRIKRRSLAGRIVLVLIALPVMIVSSFVAVELPTGTGHNLLNVSRQEIQSVVSRVPEIYQKRFYAQFPEVAQPVTSIRYDMYTPQAPVAIALGYIFGWPIATIAAALFVGLGLLGPLFHVYLFASGGGLDYYTQPGFGYLIGMIAATAFVGKITRGERTSVRQFGALAAGLFCVHFLGIVWVLGCSLAFAFCDPATTPDWLPWVFEQIRNMSWYPLPYDAIFGMILIGIGFPIRYLVNILTAPDIGLRSRAEIMAHQQMEELLH